MEDGFVFFFIDETFEILLTKRNNKTKEKVSSFLEHKVHLFENSNYLFLKKRNLEKMKAYI